MKKNSKKRTILRLSGATTTLLISLGLQPLSIQAQGIYRFDQQPPIGLLPGQSYRIAFVTNSRIDALSADLERYNTFAQREAEENPILASLGADWNAIASTNEINAKYNTDTDPDQKVGVPIFLVDGVSRVAENNQDLWNGSLGVPIGLDQNGELPPRYDGSGRFGIHNPGERLVWTGTQPGGNVDLQFGVALPPYNAVTYGSAERADSTWVERHGAESGETLLPIYAISSEITAAPEPSGLLAFGSFVVAVYLLRHRKKTESIASTRH